MEAGNVVLH